MLKQKKHISFLIINKEVPERQKRKTMKAKDRDK